MANADSYPSGSNQCNHLDTLPFLGQTYTLKLHLAQGFSYALLNADAKEIHLYITSVSHHMTGVRQQRKKILESFYKTHLKKIASAMIQEYASLMKVSVHQLKIKKVTSYWGICYWQKKEIYLNLALCILPIETIRAVVVHELCHLLVHNHSKQFYKKMTFFLPSWQQDYLPLKDNKAILFFRSLCAELL